MILQRPGSGDLLQRTFVGAASIASFTLARSIFVRPRARKRNNAIKKMSYTGLLVL